jgi:hypothetical protein
VTGSNALSGGSGLCRHLSPALHRRALQRLGASQESETFAAELFEPLLDLLNEPVAVADAFSMSFAVTRPRVWSHLSAAGASSADGFESFCIRAAP